MQHSFTLLLLSIGFLACQSTDTPIDKGGTATIDSIATVTIPEPVPPPSYSQLFDPILADGFDFPVGDKNAKGSYTAPSGKTYAGWYIATETAEHYSLGIHTGEDWNGNGGGETDFGQPVYAIGKGIVIAAQDYGAPWGNVVLLEHHFLENNIVKTVYSQYAHLNELKVAKGDTIERRRLVGTIGNGGGVYPAHLHLEVRAATMADYDVTYWPSSNGKDETWVRKHYLEPTAFIKAHRSLTVPIKESNFIFVKKSEYTLYYFENGKLDTTYEIALSQNPVGHKVEQGDNRLPEGAYAIIQKSDGPFSGDMGPFFGTGWMRLNYPNPFDTKAAYDKGWIKKDAMNSMIRRWNEGKEPSKHTRLGGGIGIHGWSGSWAGLSTRNLTWGCISMHNEDLTHFFKQVPLQTKIVIVP